MYKNSRLIKRKRIDVNMVVQFVNIKSFIIVIFLSNQFILLCDVS